MWIMKRVRLYEYEKFGIVKQVMLLKEPISKTIRLCVVKKGGKK